MVQDKKKLYYYFCHASPTLSEPQIKLILLISPISKQSYFKNNPVNPLILKTAKPS